MEKSNIYCVIYILVLLLFNTFQKKDPRIIKLFEDRIIFKFKDKICLSIGQ